MNIMFTKKIILSLIVVIMIFGLTTPVLAADQIGVTKSSVNFRTKDNTKTGKIMATLKKGQEVTIKGKTSNGWYKVEYKEDGYIHKNYISKKSKTLGKTTTAVNFRIKPNSKTGAILAVLKKGQEVTLKELNGSWYNVTYKQTGYISGNYINVLGKTNNPKPNNNKTDTSKPKDDKKDTQQPTTTKGDKLTVYLTNYKPSDDNNGNYQTSELGKVLKKDSKGRIGIIHPDIYTNSKGWYVYRYKGVDYVILARLKNKKNSYCGIERREIVEFTYKDVTYKGVILDYGGTKRDYPTLDIFRTMECKDSPGKVKTTAVATNQYIEVSTNHNNKYKSIIRYK